MKYRGQEFQYDSDSNEMDTDIVRQQTSGKQYRRKRSISATRRRSSKGQGNKPNCGIGARRNRRWSW